MKRQQLIKYLDSYLKTAEIKDYGPQGLQVETSNADVKKIALAVDVSPEILRSTIDWGADMLLVHHGIFWGKQELIRGALGERVRLMMENGVNLYAAHLALDAHVEVGNNAILGEIFGLEEISWWFSPMGVPLGVVGDVRPIRLKSLVKQVEAKLQTTCQVLPYGEDVVMRLAILSGAGADQVLAAKETGADTYHDWVKRHMRITGKRPTMG